MSESPRSKPPVRQVPSRSGGGSGGNGGYGRSSSRSGYGAPPPPPRNYRNVRPRDVPPPRDPFPYIMGAIIGALVVGLMLVVFLLINSNKTTSPPLVTSSGTPVAGAGDQATPVAEATPPRMPMDQFKALYDNPAKRPLIIDVRAKESYDAGHISGAISFPEADVDTRINEIPKDKLVIAYCQ
jgi:hypothetical protein